MISPSDSASSESSASSSGFDHPAGVSKEESRLTSYSSAEEGNAESTHKNGQVARSVGQDVGRDSRDDGGTTPVALGVQSRVKQDVVSIDTLKTYHIDHFLDTDPEYIVIPRSVPDYEMDFLKRHTHELKNASEATLGFPILGSALPPEGSSSGPPAPPKENLLSPPPSFNFDVSIKVKDADLLLEINRIPFANWLDEREDNKRGKSVLDVAMKPKDQGPSDALGQQSTTEVPVRLAVNSELLRNQLNKFTDFDMDADNNVMYPPWKVGVTYHEEIRKRLQELEKKLEEHEATSTKDEKTNDEASPPFPEIADGAEITIEKGITVEKDSSLGTCEVCDKEDHVAKLECLKDLVNHLKCLVGFIDNDLKHVFEFRKGLEDCTIKEIAFEDLWHLYTPGDLLITSGEPHKRQAYRVFYTSGGRPTRRNSDFDDGPRMGPRRNNFDDGPMRPIAGWKSAKFEKIPLTSPFAIHCYYIDFDKRWLGPAHQIITIPRYEGKRPITGIKMMYSDVTSRLPATAFPVRFLEDREMAIANLVKRGKRHRQLTPFSHKKYVGYSSVVDPEYLNSEIIIDFEQQGLVLDGIGRFDDCQINTDEVPEGCTLHDVCYDCGDLFNDNVVDRELAIRYKQDQHLMNKKDASDENLTDDHYMLMRAEVNAWVLRERCEFGVYVDLVQDLDGDHGGSLKALKKQSGFEDLVLPEGHGDLVEALVRTHRSTRKPREEGSNVQVDLIDGKGEGLVILLHGVPGVGKTSTAECVAAYTRRPLYPITCANIGLDPEEVEDKLTGASGHFRRAQQWNCVVLLDEADVFLAKREARDNDSKRNALVSVFLRILEFYPGILILTTNRVGAFDEAVVSRIQLFLYYPPLDEEKTMKVWRVHINRIRASGLINIDREDQAMILEFAEQEYAEGRRWNGRQIRNFFQTAISLASYDATKWRQQSIEDGEVAEDSKPEKPRLTTRTLKIVAATSGKFIDYINATVPDGSHQKQQLDEGNRNDGWEETPKKAVKKR